jgi:hypothetical protein
MQGRFSILLTGIFFFVEFFHGILKTI